MPTTTLEEMVHKLHEGRNSISSSTRQAPIYISEDYNLTDNDDKPRIDMRSFVKNLQRQKLISDSDFICMAHWARYENNSVLVDTLEKMRLCRSELDRITLVKKKLQRSQKILAEHLSLEGVTYVF